MNSGRWLFIAILAHLTAKYTYLAGVPLWYEVTLAGLVLADINWAIETINRRRKRKHGTQSSRSSGMPEQLP